jgi:DNA-binding transcriptional regulator YhcF (GntR family)
MVQRRTDVAAALRQRLLSGLHLGVLRPGGKLPPVRELARELGADPRVVLAAYQQLEKEGIVELRQRSGIYVAPVGRLIGDERAHQAEWVVDAVLEGLRRGIPAPAYARRVEQYLTRLRLRAACVECNRDQIAALSTELEADYGFEVAGVNVDDLASDRPPEALRRADLVVTTPFHAGVVSDVARRLGKSWVAASLRVDVYAEIARLLPTRPVYFVVSDPTYATKLRGIFGNVPGGTGFRALVYGRDALGEIPADAPTYISRTARERLDDARLLARVMPEQRALSTESAREILTFVVRANMAAARGAHGAE